MLVGIFELIHASTQIDLLPGGNTSAPSTIHQFLEVTVVINSLLRKSE
jgi:hypothetical protein